MKKRYAKIFAHSCWRVKNVDTGMRFFCQYCKNRKIRLIEIYDTRGQTMGFRMWPCNGCVEGWARRENDLEKQSLYYRCWGFAPRFIDCTLSYADPDNSSPFLGY